MSSPGVCCLEVARAPLGDPQQDPGGCWGGSVTPQHAMLHVICGVVLPSNVVLDAVEEAQPVSGGQLHLTMIHTCIRPQCPLKCMQALRARLWHSTRP